MAIPLKYNFRNLVVRWISATMLVVGIALVTTIFVFMTAMGVGLEKTLVGTGHPLNLIVLRPRATETTSGMTREQVSNIAALDGVAKDARGEPLASPELVAVASHVLARGQKANLAMRGVGPRARDLREVIKVTEGAWFKPGLGELVAGKGAAGRFAGLKVGDRPFIRGRTWTVVGIFDADGQAYESEVWGDIDDLRTQFKREYSTVILRARDLQSMTRMTQVIKDDRQIQLEAKPHADYYKSQNQGAEMMKGMGFMIGFVMSFGAIFGAANMMYGAVAHRTREIATMRVLGFKRLSIGFSFVLEAAFLGLCGGALGSVLSRIFFDGITSGTANWETFSDVSFNFRVTPELMVNGVVVGVLMAVVGGFFPAWRASRLTIARALRGM
jgi:putative ABC transport system permease protein